MELYLVIGRGKLFVFRQREKGFEEEFFNGEPCFPYEATRIPEAVEKLQQELKDNYNLACDDPLPLKVILTSDKLLNQAFERALTGMTMLPLKPLLEKAIRQLSRDTGNFIPKLGINYEGRSYIRQGNGLKSADFSLVAYTLEPGQLLDLAMNLP